MSDTWVDLVAKSNLSANDLATAINTLMANERLMKGGTGSDAPSTTIEALAANVAANVVTDSYEADTSSAVTLVYTDGNKVFNPTSAHDINLAKAGVTARYRRTYFNRSSTNVLTVKATNSTPGDGGTVCIILPLGWVTLQVRQATPTSNTHWMQADAGGDWATAGITQANFNDGGWGTVTLPTGGIMYKRDRSDLVFQGSFLMGTLTGSASKILLPHGLSSVALQSRISTYGYWVRIYNTTTTYFFNGNNQSGVFYYSATHGANYVGVASSMTGSLIDEVACNGIWQDGNQLSFSNIRIPISGWGLG